MYVLMAILLILVYVGIWGKRLVGRSIVWVLGMAMGRQMGMEMEVFGLWGDSWGLGHCIGINLWIMSMFWINRKLYVAIHTEMLKHNYGYGSS